jgi:hypothetical protein
MIVVYDPKEPVCGLTSSIRWNGSPTTDRMLEEAMNQLFQVRHFERITHLEINKEGIKAIIAANE